MEEALKDPNSTLHLYRKMNEIRKASDVLIFGETTMLKTAAADSTACDKSNAVISYVRSLAPAKDILVTINLSPSEVNCDLSASSEFSTTRWSKTGDLLFSSVSMRTGQADNTTVTVDLSQVSLAPGEALLVEVSEGTKPDDKGGLSAGLTVLIVFAVLGLLGAGAFCMSKRGGFKASDRYADIDAK